MVMDLLSSKFILILLSASSLLFSKVVPETPLDESGDLMVGPVATYDEDDHLWNAERQFEIFKAKFGKNYTTRDEHDRRFSIFKANLRRARRHQLLDPSAVHGVTQFSDLTPPEFYGFFLGLKPFWIPFDAQKAPILPTNNLPTEFDWRKHGAVTSVKYQV